MGGFGRWLEARVRGSAAGDAMRRTLEFKVDAEWIKWSVEPKGWITDKGVKDSFDLSVAFYSQKVPKPAFFSVRAGAILDKPDAEYDSVVGSEEMKITATISLLSGKKGMGGVPTAKSPKNMRDLLDSEGFIHLSERNDHIYFGGALSEFDGPSLRTPLQLAEWVNRVVENTDIGGGDDGDEDPEQPDVPEPDGRRLIGV